MKAVVARELRARLRSQHGLIARTELRLLGVTEAEERHRRATGEWDTAGPGVVRIAGSPRTPEQDLMAACLGAGASGMASHQSAAWLWGLLPRPPGRHAVTVSRSARTRLEGVDLHRPVDYPLHAVIVRGIPCTNPLRTLVDLAGVSPAGTLDDAVDRALAAKLLSVEGIEAELGRLGRPGRRGVAAMRASLNRRGFRGAPNPSVLESRTLRLLRQFGIEPLATEVRMGPGGRYRVDILLAPGVVMEVDGSAYHSDPEQVAEDKRRRSQLRMEGTIVLEYTWRDIMYDARRVAREVRQALAQAGAAQAAATQAAQAAGAQPSGAARGEMVGAQWQTGPRHG